jgi:acetylornithine deacetylase/succinyl-diaminopimelate desuccinylase-like protein
MRFIAMLGLFAAFPPVIVAQADAHRARERELLKELVEINTSDSARHTDLAARAMARHLVAAGIPQSDVRVMELTPGIHTLVARYRGRKRDVRPILLMAHIDVVDARREDWTVDPYTFLERDGYYYARGASDNKAGAAMLVANFIRYKQEGYIPERDLIIVLTGDEETTSDAISTLLARHRELVDAEYALNTDAGGGEIHGGQPTQFVVQTAEKVYLSFALEVRNKGGHSSVPEPDNAIYRLTAAVERLAAHRFPVRLNPTTTGYFERSAANQPADIAADMRSLARSRDSAAAMRLAARVPYYNALMRTTCVATRLFAGHADNALPQLARATVNCRLLPDEPPDSVQAILTRIIGDTAVHLSQVDTPTPSPASPLRTDIMGPIEQLAREMWPQAALVPEMSTGATDGLYVRNAGIPVYGVSAVFERIDDVRAHGRDERIGVKAFHDAAAFWYRLVKTLGSAAPGT